MKLQLADVQDRKKLGQSLDMAKDLVTKDYLYKLGHYEVAEAPEELNEIEISNYTRVYKLTRLVSDREESVIDKMVSVLNAVYTSQASVATLISGHKESIDYYMIVVCKDIGQKNVSIKTQGETLSGALSGNFPGLEIEGIKGDAKKQLLESVFHEDYVTCVSGIASIRNEKDHSYEKFVQGIEHLVDSLQGREYNVVILADSVSAQEISAAKLGYETLHTQLSSFLKATLTFNESESITLTKSHAEGVTESVGDSLTLTQNYSRTNGWSSSSSYGTSRNRDVGHLAGGVLGAAAGLGATLLTGGAAAPLIAASAFAGSQIGGGLIGSYGENVNQAEAESGGEAEAVGTAKAKNYGHAVQSNNMEGEAESESHGKTIQFTHENKTVKNLLGIIDGHIERLRKCESYGAFNCAAYIISSDPETNAVAASAYNALMRGDNSSLQAAHINNWNLVRAEGSEVKKYLTKFSHPLFKNPVNDNILLSPAAIANSCELAVNMGFPKKSVSGLPVYEMASFGRNVFETEKTDKWEGRVELGNIYHMGKKQPIPVSLNLKSLAMHTFITGSTGSGKSNTVYQMLRQLSAEGVHFLVIEPAKGEYKHIFADSGAAVYGTNLYQSPLLKLNPFRFPKGVHVLEHIDRLIEIFNVCWPMYAAMPAVLKEAVEGAYTGAGWNLVTSCNAYSDELFPTFADVLAELTRVVEESAFSQEVKDNYKGSLITRVKSLTNGMYGRIFDRNELGDEKLFDENVIVDLSRVGSVETKSMIMGILVMRLQEYRMTSGKMNADLSHVTVLEEAHNLLKRTSTEQSSETANLLGKSVEMLSNAIAEVRTYGEGFIIADQAPGLLDLSVIRNTNTKIIMRLPDAQDRSLVGQSANLSEGQIKELAKIPTGVAAVYQNNWLEPVLCKVHYVEPHGNYTYTGNGSAFGEDDGIVLEKLLDKAAGEKLDMNMDDLIRKVIASSALAKTKAEIIRILKQNGRVELKDISSVVYDMVSSPELEKEAENAESIEEWKNAFIYGGCGILSALSAERQNRIMECILREQIARYDKPEEYLETWYQYTNKGVV